MDICTSLPEFSETLPFSLSLALTLTMALSDDSMAFLFELSSQKIKRRQYVH